MNVKTYADLYADTLSLLPRLPPISEVWGVPRSGMLPAAILATELNVPLGMVGARGIGGGQRLDRATGHSGRVLVIDDSVGSGHAIREARRRKPDALYACVYMRPGKQGLVDIFAQMLPRPRIFAWSLWHSAMIESCLTDFDGVLCVDPTVREDDQAAYAEWLREAVPLYRPRRVAGIVTNRLERYRADTEQWLLTHGIDHGGLTMQPYATPRERRKQSDTAAYKAEVYAASDAPLFIESYDKQAARIAELSCKPVLAVPSWTLYERGTLTP